MTEKSRKYLIAAPVPMQELELVVLATDRSKATPLTLFDARALPAYVVFDSKAVRPEQSALALMPTLTRTHG
jgi:hypothetical protein